MIPSLHEIVHRLTIAKGTVNFVAAQIEPADPKGPAALRKFGEELWEVWTRHRPFLPNNREIALALESFTKNSKIQISKDDGVH